MVKCKNGGYGEELPLRRWLFLLFLLWFGSGVVFGEEWNERREEGFEIGGMGGVEKRTEWNERREEIMEAVMGVRDEESLSEEEMEEIEEDLEVAARRGVDLNGRHLKEDLENLHFLTAQQIESLCFYAYRYGPVRSVDELSLVEGLYERDVANLLPFVRVGSGVGERDRMQWGEVLRNGTYEVVTKYKRTLETKLGYTDSAYKKGGRAYLGDPNYGNVQLRSHFGDRLYFGVSGDKDAGEQFWNDSIKGFDSYNFYFQYNGARTGGVRISRLCLGDYNVRWGKGLVVNTGYNYGVMGTLLSSGSETSEIRRFTGVSERPRMRGAGTELKFGDNLTATLVVSRYTGDASISKQGTFTHLLSDGYHRTASELKHKDSVVASVLGGRVEWEGMRLRVGLHALHTRYDRACVPTNQAYAQNYFRGRDAFAGGMDYGWHLGRVMMSGELATDKDGHLAMLHSVSLQTSRVGVSVTWRDYSRRYDHPWANGLEQGGRVHNERGLSLAAMWRPSSAWKMVSYMDLYRYPDVKYRISQPTDGVDAYARVDWMPVEWASVWARGRYRACLQDIGSKSKGDLQTLDYVREAFTLCGAVGVPSKVLSFSPRVDVTRAHHVDTLSATYGCCVSGTLRLRSPWRWLPLQANARYAWYSTESYDNVVYVYEDDVLYSFTSMQATGRGSRMYMTVKWQPLKWLSVYGKVARSARRDQDYMGSSYDRIDKPHRTDVSVLLRLTL